jgi:hypothetical protein
MNETERTRKEVIMNEFKILPQHMTALRKTTKTLNQDSWTESRFEPRTSQTRSRSATHSNAASGVFHTTEPHMKELKNQSIH